MESFNEINLPENLRKALKELKFEKPTPIQAKAIPPGMLGGDLLATAQTGTGKTAAFAIPIVAKVLEKPNTVALILTPTRELAMQIADVMRNLTKFSHHIRSALLIGGAGMGSQMRAIEKKASVIIATSGRLMDHVRRRTLDLSKISMVVLDEADRMLDMGFAPQIEEVFEFLPRERQTLLFSATLPPQILKLASRFMRNAERIVVGELNRAAEKIKQEHIQVGGAEKNDRILKELATRTGSVLIFARTKIRTDRLAKFLKKNDLQAASIHGGRTQSQRNEALSGFRSMKYPVLVATDVAARGLDIPFIQTVINFDLPQTYEDYIHRIGRTARAGECGEALSFVTPEESSHWKMVSTGNVKFIEERGRRNSRRKPFRSGNSGKSFNRFNHKRGKRNSQAGFVVARD